MRAVSVYSGVRYPGELWPGECLDPLDLISTNGSWQDYDSHLLTGVLPELVPFRLDRQAHLRAALIGPFAPPTRAHIRLRSA